MLEKVFDSWDVPVRDRVDGWREMLTLAPAPDLMAIDSFVDFQASLRAAHLGGTQVFAHAYPSLRTWRTAKMIRRDDPELYSVALVLRGQQEIGQARRNTTPGIGNMVMYSSRKPYEMQVKADDGTAAALVAQVPRALLPLSADKLDRLLVTRLPGREGIGALVVNFLTHLATDAGPYRPADGVRLGTVLLDLLTAMLAHHLEDDSQVPPESRERTLVLQIKRFLHQHLGDPRLSADSIAAAHHISTRHLHRLFQSHGHTVAAWIRSQRLEHARRDLTDPALAYHPIHAIAARWGFTHGAAFSRTFRAAYGLTPQDYRHHAHLSLGANRQRACHFTPTTPTMQLPEDGRKKS
ncbi:AraC family transcriptional regulator [Streptomyces niveus]|uniref:AraC family transcriptional regulator n=1 Tax=Streptomyces niveus TaxID=193462 RepID=UPI0034396225